MPEIQHCPGTLVAGQKSYSVACLRRMFRGRKVSHLLPYDRPAGNQDGGSAFLLNRQRISISGVQEKYSLVLAKNQLRLTEEGEQGQYILKPIPSLGKRPEQIPANEHLTMQIARQVYGIETAENALIFFQEGSPAYLTQRFDVQADGSKWAVEDFASVAGKTPQTHGEHYKYQGNYLELFALMKQSLPAYQVEAPKLFRRILFNYLFSNGDAHIKNFSLLETSYGDFRLSPAYDLLNTRLHIEDAVFALEEGLLPKSLAKGKVLDQFRILANEAGLLPTQREQIIAQLCLPDPKVPKLVEASFLDQKAKRSYWQFFQTRINKLSR